MTKIIKRLPQLTDISISEISLLDRVYKARNITDLTQIDYRFKNLLLPNNLFDIERATELLVEALTNNSRIIIVGDYDTDGATSTAVAIKSLLNFGYENISYLIPDRFTHGYGLSLQVAEILLKQGVDVVITVDNGISCFEGIEYLKQHKIITIITDHHLAAEQLPNADAIINPNQNNCQFESKNLAGVGVIFYLMWQLRNKLQNYFPDKKFPSLTNVLDLVALGTVADVVPLDYNNRILVKQGLQLINNAQCCIGIKALLKVAGKTYGKIQASDLGFSIAPRLNAAGRLDNMAMGVELLLTDNEIEALSIAQDLNALNLTRRDLESLMKDEALSICQNLEQRDDFPLGIVLYDDNWHQGVIGIVAARVKDIFYRPVIVFALDNEKVSHQPIIKGSARSILGLHIKNILTELDNLNPGLIISFGGHAMAAGLSILKDNLLEFNQKFNQLLNKYLSADLLENIIYTDGELVVNEFNLSTVEMLKQAGPWGQHFPEPIFDGYFKVINFKIISGKHVKLLVQPIQNDNLLNIFIDAIKFNCKPDDFDPQVKKVHLVYNIEKNEFNSNQSLQLIIREIINLYTD